jgi:glycosyltransferase involved in cell wall biosynthesis
LKVAFQGSLSFGGVGTVTRELPPRLARHASVVVFDVNRFRLGGLSPSDAEATGIYARGMSLGPPLNVFRHAIAFRRFDIVHVNYGLYGVSAFASNKLSRVPYVETVHGIPQPELESGYDKVGYFAEQWALPLTSGSASLVVSDSEYIRRGLKSRYSIESQLIPLGVDVNRFHPPTKEEASIARRKLGIRTEEVVVLFAGRLHPWKDPLTLVRAAPPVLESERNARIFLVGKGSMEQSVHDLAESLGVAKKVTVVNNVDYNNGLTDYYLASDIFVLPTKKEGFGLVLLEAMASGLPVVASDGGASPELIGESGLLFRTGDPFSLAQEILSLASDRSFRERLGRQARERAVNLFDWERCSNSYLQAYSNIVDRESNIIDDRC